MKDGATANVRRSFRRLAIAAALILVSVGAFLAASLHDSYARYRSNADDDLQNLTLNLERYLATRFQSADIVLRSAVQSFEGMSLSTPVSTERFTGVLSGLRNWLPDNPDLRASDNNGMVLYGDGVDMAHPLSIEGRQFYREAKATVGLVVGLPLKSRISNRWVLPLARQMRDAHGDFAGVVYVNIDMEDFIATLRSLKIGSRGVIVLFNDRREVLFRLPDHPLLKDEAPARLSAPETLQALAAGKGTATFDAYSSIDQRLRSLMFRKVGSFSVYVLAGLERNEYLAPWYEELVVTIAFWLALVAGAILLLLTQRRADLAQTRVLAELNAAKKQAETAK